MVQNIVGLTGLIGSGKSITAELFANYGVAVIDTDKISHQLTEINGLAIEPIRSEFGDDFINNGILNRSLMRELVFTDQTKLKKLENILHPLIFDEVRHQVKNSSGLYVLIVVPLLFRSIRFMSYVSRTIFVDCEIDVLINRVIKRNNLNRDEVLAILSQQVSREEQLSMADDVLDNSQNLEYLKNQVAHLHNHYQSIFS